MTLCKFIYLNGTHITCIYQCCTIKWYLMSPKQKLCYLVAGKRLHKKMSSTSLTVYVNSVELEQVQSHKLLGVIIDTQLNFNEHIDNLCKKLTQRIAVLKKIRHHLPLDQQILYFNAMIKQTMMYGSSVWVSTSVDNLNKVFRLQKRAARVILNADTRANSVDL